MEVKKNFYESRSFTCRKCGRQVVTPKGLLDRRTVFCSSSCSRRYWRHPELRKKKISADI